MLLLTSGAKHAMKYIDKDCEQSIGWALHVAGIATVALVVGAYYLFVYQQLETRKQSDLIRIDQLRTLLSKSATVQQENLGLQQELTSLQASISAIRQRLPHELQQSQFANELNRVAGEVGLQVLDLNWGVPEVTPSYTQAEVQIECDGSYDSICRFLNEVGQLTRITDITQLQLESVPESRNRPFGITFVLYYGVDSKDSDKNQGEL
jgi:Tfp pilus assembly protein PilO